MADLKTMKVLNVRTHVGGLHGKTSYDSVKDKADMEEYFEKISQELEVDLDANRAYGET